MAISNRDRINKALELLAAGAVSFVERELQAVLGVKWRDAIDEAGPRATGRKTLAPNLSDPQVLLGVMWNRWNDVFARTLGHAERSLVSELRDVRNKWAHNEAFAGNDAYRALDRIGRLLTAVSAPQAAEVEQMRMDLLRLQFEEQRRGEMRKASFQPTDGKPQGGLPPWREVVTPHPDVSSGRYQQAEFAADLWQVYLQEGSDEYKHPTEFYRRTFITEGLKYLLIRGLQRLSGAGGDPVVELQTNFGGGKTHSMLALWHLFSGTAAGDLPGVEELVNESGVKIATGVRRAVLVGTKIPPGQPNKKADGTKVKTLWGEIAWQLGGKEGYKLVKEADETSTNPGDALKDLFNKYSPCLILIDEWVAYARQLHDGSILPAGSFDTQFTFAQTLTESAKAAKKTLVVVSVPSSDNEIGGDWGQKALERLKNAIGRVEASWRPASPDEGFEIVRRRLFQPLNNEKAKLRDAVARAFSDLYGQQQQEFPQECREGDYERRIKMAYPIHPELFDRLYNDWSTLDKFQRTRGVLRLMAAVIHSLWDRDDKNLMIIPSMIPVDDSFVQHELTRYMEDQWVPVIEKDVDGAHSLPLALDRDNPNLGRSFPPRGGSPGRSISVRRRCSRRPIAASTNGASSSVASSPEKPWPPSATPCAGSPTRRLISTSTASATGTRRCRRWLAWPRIGPTSCAIPTWTTRFSAGFASKRTPGPISPRFTLALLAPMCPTSVRSGSLSSAQIIRTSPRGRIVLPGRKAPPFSNRAATARAITRTRSFSSLLTRLA